MTTLLVEGGGSVPPSQRRARAKAPGRAQAGGPGPAGCIRGRLPDPLPRWPMPPPVLRARRPDLKLAAHGPSARANDRGLLIPSVAGGDCRATSVIPYPRPTRPPPNASARRGTGRRIAAATSWRPAFRGSGVGHRAEDAVGFSERVRRTKMLIPFRPRASAHPATRRRTPPRGSARRADPARVRARRPAAARAPAGRGPPRR